MAAWLVALLMMPVGVAGGGNSFSSTVVGEGNAVASCQLAIVVGSVTILGLDDGLGLVTRAREVSEAPLVPPGSGSRAFASCETVVEKLRIHGAPGRSGRTFVSGPELVGAVPGDGGSTSRSFSLPSDNVLSVCQRTLYIDSAILGGTSVGLASGWAMEPVRLSFVTSPYASASCLVDVRDIEFVSPSG